MSLNIAWYSNPWPLSPELTLPKLYGESAYYALRKLKAVEVYLYQVDFKLREFKKWLSFERIVLPEPKRRPHDTGLPRGRF